MAKNLFKGRIENEFRTDNSLQVISYINEASIADLDPNDSGLELLFPEDLTEMEEIISVKALKGKKFRCEGSE